MRLFGRKNDLPPSLLVLREVPLFSTLNRRELKLIGPILHERTYSAGEMVFEEGELGLGVYVIGEGTVRIFRSGAGVPVEVARLGRGQFFGELALLDGAPRSASARAETDARLWGFFRPQFMEILERHGCTGGKISLQLARLLGARLRASLGAQHASGAV